MAASPTTAETKVTSVTAASGLLIFDGDCGFCTSTARKFAVFADESASIAPWQSLELEDYGLSEEQASSAVYWVHDGRQYRGADAVANALRVCGRPWSVLGAVLAVPPFIWLARAIYPVVAKYRYRLPGATNACRIG